MTEDQNKIDLLLKKLDILLKKHEEFSQEIQDIESEIRNFTSYEKAATTHEPNLDTELPYLEIEQELQNEKVNTDLLKHQLRMQKQSRNIPIKKVSRPKKQKKARESNFNFEKFIGENLLNKIGIAITVIGVAIGAKYSIEHELISPLTRIILGYLAGIGLLGFGMKLKKNYTNYSAVLVSGSIAIMYFITYAAYSFYGLFPQSIAFALMVVFTAFTVVASLNYNMQVIAHIGLVGAYAVPFLLSEGSGKVEILFGYMAIINIGMLVIAFKKYWKSINYSSFALTWLIFSLWYGRSYFDDSYFGISIFFLTVFFAIFYMTFLAYKLIQKEKFEALDIILLLTNSFIFYGLGYSILFNNSPMDEFLGLFTLNNGIIHFIVAVIIYRYKLADRNLFFLISGLVLVFLTITIPVQLDGNWVTLLWVGEAALLFWIGRVKNVPVYEYLSYPLMILAFGSLWQDWLLIGGSYKYEEVALKFTPFLNISFLSSILFIFGFSIITSINHKKSVINNSDFQKEISKIISIFIPTVLIFTIYNTFRLEIANYYDQLYYFSKIEVNTEDIDYSYNVWNSNLNRFKLIWLINYSLFFVSLLSFINLKKLKNIKLSYINFGINIVAIGVFLTVGLYELSELRNSYLYQKMSDYYEIGSFSISIRYISYIFIALAFLSWYYIVRQKFLNYKYKKAFEIILSISLLWIISSELFNLLDLAGNRNTYKLGLSILWGVYSLIIISLGIWQKKKYLRIGAFILIGMTLLKLFTYDISHMNTISKTIVFVSLGILLLITSFLYNKYKNIISDEIKK